MKRLRIGRRRSNGAQQSSPLELALSPALVDERWRIPDRFNFTRDVVEALALDPKRRALTFSGGDGIIEPRTFLQLAEGAASWASQLRERGVAPGDRVLVLLESSAAWLEIVLGCLKAGAVTVPCSTRTSAQALEALVASTGAALVVADHTSRGVVAQMSFAPELQLLDDVAPPKSMDELASTPTHDTSSRDVAFVLTAARGDGDPKLVAHTHGAAFAARVQAEHWLDASRGDAVWCTADTGSAAAVWSGLLGPWARGAELVLHEGAFDAQAQLDLIHRLGVTILCQTPSEYRALAELPRRDLERYQSRRLRRLVATGDYLEPDVVAVFEELWGMTVHDGYGQAETNVVIANGADAGYKPGSLGLPLPGHHVAVVDGQGNELPDGVEGDVAVRGRPPTLFAGYWESPDETKQAFSGDWYVTGDVAVRDEEGFFWFVGRTSDVIASRGRTFGPHEIERVLREHAAVRRAAVVGVRDLERGGHFVRAFVVLQPRASASEQLEAELRQHVADALPEQHVPREVEFIDELPTTPSGKVRRDELRERPVIGRSLWEAAPTAAIVETPEPVAPMPEPVAASPEPVAPEPAPATPAPPGLSEPAPEPVAEAALSPSAFRPVAPDRADTDTEKAAEVVPELPPEPTPEPEVPSPALLQPATTPEPVVEPVSVEPVVFQPVVPEPAVEPEPLPEHVVEPAPEAGPVARVASEPTPPAAPPEHAPLPEYVVDPASAPEPVAPGRPEPELEEEPDLGPLPDYVVDPERPRPLEPVPAPTPEEPAAQTPPPPEQEDPIKGLGLRPVTEFPQVESSTERETSSGRRRTSRNKSAKAERPSEGEPGDDGEEIGWMQGLSNRLSAYSLETEPESPAPAAAPEDEAETDGTSDETERT